MQRSGLTFFILYTFMVLIFCGCGDKLEAKKPLNKSADTSEKANPDTDNSTQDESRDTGTQDPIEFYVSEGGYVVAGPWKGFSFIYLTGEGTTSKPPDFAQVGEGQPLCASGTVAAMPNWSGTAMVGFHLNQDYQKDAPLEKYIPITPESDSEKNNTGGIDIDISNPGGTEIRVQINGPSGHTNANDRWCAVVKDFNRSTIPWHEFNTRCWDNSGLDYTGEPLVSIMILVPGHNQNDRDYDICLNELLPYQTQETSIKRPIDTDFDTGEPLDTDLIPKHSNVGFVGENGRIKVDGADLKNEHGEIIVLRGLSLFWSQWSGPFYNKELVDWLVEDWNINVIRAALGIMSAGNSYLTNPTPEMQKIFTVVNAAIEAGIYVIIDWHAHNANQHPAAARAFFETMAKMYNEYPNVIYEIWNEPLNTHNWQRDIKPYAEYVIEGIRQYDTNNLILVGTRSWSQELLDVINNEIEDHNVAYTMHFYSGMHGHYLQSRTNTVRKLGIPVFISEWGVWSEGYIDNDHLNEVNVLLLEPWLQWADENNLSMTMWSVFDKDEPSAIVKPGASPQGGWAPEELTTIGTYMHSVFNSTSGEETDESQEENP